jgi:PhnB protein
MCATKHIQEGYTSTTAYLYAKLDLIDFIKNAFGAEVTHNPTPDGSENSHAEPKVGDAPLLLGSGYFSDPSIAAAIYLYGAHVDATYKRALSPGAKSVREPSDLTWGDRVGGVRDTSGNTWWIATNRGAR